MKVIYTKDVSRNEKQYHIKDVKDGYARYLISNDLAVVCNDKNKAKLDKYINNKKEIDNKKIDSANNISRELEKEKLVFKVNASSEGKVFGSVSSKQVLDKLSDLGYDTSSFKANTKSLDRLGDNEFIVNLYKNIDAKINVRLEKE